MNKQYGEWIDISILPKKEGWYLTRYKHEKQMAMYFKTIKLNYSDTQWYTSPDYNHSWGGRLPNQWLMLLDVENK